MGTSRARLMRSMSARELAEWRAYERIDPFGMQRYDIHAALICCTLANGLLRSKESHPEPFKIEDFLLNWNPDDSKAEETPNNPLLASIIAWNKVLGGKDLRER